LSPSVEKHTIELLIFHWRHWRVLLSARTTQFLTMLAKNLATLLDRHLYIQKLGLALLPLDLVHGMSILSLCLESLLCVYEHRFHARNFRLPPNLCQLMLVQQRAQFLRSRRPPHRSIGFDDLWDLAHLGFLPSPRDPDIHQVCLRTEHSRFSLCALKHSRKRSRVPLRSPASKGCLEEVARIDASLQRHAATSTPCFHCTAPWRNDFDLTH